MSAKSYSIAPDLVLASAMLFFYFGVALALVVSAIIVSPFLLVLYVVCKIRGVGLLKLWG